MRRSLILVSLLVACSPAGSEPEGSPHGVRAIVGARSVALRSDGFVSRGGTVVSIGARTPDDALHSLAVSAPSFADEPMSIALASRGGSGTRIALAPLGLRHVPWKLESGTLVAEDVGVGSKFHAS